MKTVALVIGHSKKSQGASNKASGLTEWVYNNELAIAIEQQGIQDVNFIRTYRNSYTQLPHELNALKPNLIISMHCNAFNEVASGTETLYYHTSKQGKQFAEIFNKHIVEVLKLPNRGIRAKTSEDRGGYLLKNTSAPCLIIEPFFIDNDSDLYVATKAKSKLVDAYVNAISDICKYL